MKKVVAVLTTAVMVVSLVSLVFAADAKQGKVKSVDAAAGSMVLSSKGGAEEATLKVDKSVDLSKVKAGDMVDVSVDNGTVMSLKKMKKAPVGC